jgi:hypothetical protein
MYTARRANLLIVETIDKLVNQAEEYNQSRICDIARAVTRYLLQSTFDLLQLAYVLTPLGRREEQSQLVASLHRADFGPVAPPDDQEIAPWRESTEKLE